MLKFLLLIFFFFPSTSSKQLYDRFTCGSNEVSPHSMYQCSNTSLTSCSTYIVYRSRAGFSTISSISSLFSTDTSEVLNLNNLTNRFQVLEESREVLLPIQCSCSGSFFQSIVTQFIDRDSTYNQTTCEVFEGLVTPSNLITPKSGLQLDVPIKCACPDENDTRGGIKFLITYPLEEYDEIELLARKFNVLGSDISLQNTLSQAQTIFPNTTILIPVRSEPKIAWNISGLSNRNPSFIPVTTDEIDKRNPSSRKYIIGITVIGIFLTIFVVLFALLFYHKTLHKWRGLKLKKFPAWRSDNLQFSPEFIAEMSKYSVRSYLIEELSEATRGFSEETTLGSSVNKGTIGGNEVVIKKLAYGDARRIIGIHSKINHANIVRLDGVCYGKNEFSPSYLLFEFAKNGCLRDCLMNPKKEIPWRIRTQIAFDVAVGLHYIHHCTIPSFIHMNITCKNILITENWHAKIANLGTGSTVVFSEEKSSSAAMTSEGWIAPEYVNEGLVSNKIDVFAFGVVLFELLSAKEAKDSEFVMESLSFLIGGVNGCYDPLRSFLDPGLKDYPKGEAICMAFIVKACLEENPVLRPSMNDILKILARMVRLHSVRSQPD